jgi:hypothetical protein
VETVEGAHEVVRSGGGERWKLLSAGAASEEEKSWAASFWKYSPVRDEAGVARKG